MSGPRILSPIQNKVRCPTCARDIPLDGDDEHAIAYEYDSASDGFAIQVSPCGKTAPWWLRVWQRIW